MATELGRICVEGVFVSMEVMLGGFGILSRCSRDDAVVGVSDDWWRNSTRWTPSS